MAFSRLTDRAGERCSAWARAAVAAAAADADAVAQRSLFLDQTAKVRLWRTASTCAESERLNTTDTSGFCFQNKTKTRIIPISEFQCHGSWWHYIAKAFARRPLHTNEFE